MCGDEEALTALGTETRVDDCNEVELPSIVIAMLALQEERPRLMI